MSEQSYEDENLAHIDNFQVELQMRLIRIFPESIAQYLPINELTIREFFNKSISAWQIEQDKKLSDLLVLPFEDQFSILKSIIKSTKSKLSKILIKSEQVAKLEFAINEYLYFYKRNLCLN